MAEEIEAAGEEVEQTTQETVEQPVTPEVKADQTAAVAEILAGGQKFRDVGHLSETYGKLLGEYTRGRQEYSKTKKEYDEYRQTIEEIKRIPGAVKAIQEYVASRGGAQAQPQEQPSTDGGRGDAEEYRIAKLELRAEVDELKSKYPSVNQDVLMEVYSMARSMAEQYGVQVPLETAYKQVMFDRQATESYKKGVDAAKKEVTQGKAAVTAQPQATSDKKKPKFSGAKKFTDREAHITKLLQERGVSLDE